MTVITCMSSLLQTAAQVQGDWAAMHASLALILANSFDYDFLDAMRPATTISRPPAQPEGPMLSPCINTAAKNALHSGRLEKMICAWGAGTLLWPCTA